MDDAAYPEVEAQPIEVLLVEDDPGDVQLTKEAFEEHKVRNRLTVVSDGVDALAYLRRDPSVYPDAVRPDLILLDLNLPRRDGREVAVDAAVGFNKAGDFVDVVEQLLNDEDRLTRRRVEIEFLQLRQDLADARVEHADHVAIQAAAALFIKLLGGCQRLVGHRVRQLWRAATSSSGVFTGAWNATEGILYRNGASGPPRAASASIRLDTSGSATSGGAWCGLMRESITSGPV